MRSYYVLQQESIISCVLQKEKITILVTVCSMEIAVWSQYDNTNPLLTRVGLKDGDYLIHNLLSLEK